MSAAIDEFRGRFFFLSNFFMHPVEYEDLEYPSAEHAFQAAKSYEQHIRVLIQHAARPSEAKRLGRQVDLRPGWLRDRNAIMEDILRAKFSDTALMKRLLDTHPRELIEGNTWGDTYWGCIRSNGEWKGKNQLGKLLMKIREELLANQLARSA